MTSSQAKGYKGFQVIAQLSEASCDLEAGYTQEVRPLATTVLSKSQDPDARAAAAFLLAAVGDSARAQQVADELAKEFPDDTLLNKVDIAAIRAMLALQRNQPAQAIAQLGSDIPIEYGAGPRSADYTPITLRAESYLRSHDGANAAAEYQKILDHRGLDPVSPLYALAHLGLGRAYALQGDNAKAKSAYQDFFAIWKDADPDVPILKTAKAEYEKLKWLSVIDSVMWGQPPSAVRRAKLDTRTDRVLTCTLNICVAVAKAFLEKLEYAICPRRLRISNPSDRL